MCGAHGPGWGADAGAVSVADTSAVAFTRSFRNANAGANANADPFSIADTDAYARSGTGRPYVPGAGFVPDRVICA